MRNERTAGSSSNSMAPGRQSKSFLEIHTVFNVGYTEVHAVRIVLQ